jgi:hypothetical protein
VGAPDATKDAAGTHYQCPESTPLLLTILSRRASPPMSPTPPPPLPLPAPPMKYFAWVGLYHDPDSADAIFSPPVVPQLRPEHGGHSPHREGGLPMSTWAAAWLWGASLIRIGSRIHVGWRPMERMKNTGSRSQSN